MTTATFADLKVGQRFRVEPQGLQMLKLGNRAALVCELGIPPVELDFEESASTPVIAQRVQAEPQVLVSGRPATHYCNTCGALWWANSHGWSLISASCGSCCDNTSMGEQIVALPAAKAE